jgi:superfamily II DNA helicase RecQ
MCVGMELEQSECISNAESKYTSLSTELLKVAHEPLWFVNSNHNLDSQHISPVKFSSTQICQISLHLKSLHNMSTRFQPAWLDGPLSERTLTLCDEVKVLWGFEVRPWQAQAIQCLLNGNDVLISASTGSGKSLVFQALALSKPNAIVLVVSPLLSLMDDQVCCLIDDH